MTQTRTFSITIEEFIRLYGDEGPFEIIEGERVPVAPQITRSGRIAGRLFLELAAYVKQNNLGEVFTEVPFVLVLELQWVAGSRVPDLMFVRADRLAQLAAADPEWENKPLTLVPDLVVEIISPTDRASDVSKKIARYLQDGVQIAWLIDPEIQVVTIHASGSKQITRLSSEDTLTGGDVVPGFEMAVAKLFG